MQYSIGFGQEFSFLKHGWPTPNTKIQMYIQWIPRFSANSFELSYTYLFWIYFWSLSWSESHTSNFFFFSPFLHSPFLYILSTCQWIFGNSDRFLTYNGMNGWAPLTPISKLSDTEIESGSSWSQALDFYQGKIHQWGPLRKIFTACKKKSLHVLVVSEITLHWELKPLSDWLIV